MELVEAIHKVERETGLKVIGLSESKDIWIFELDFDEDALISVVPCCVKSTGEFKWIFPPDELDLFENAKPLELRK